MNQESPSTPPANDYVTACNSIQERLNYLHDAKRLSWRQIAQRPEFSCVSPTMLWKVANGYRPRGKTRELLGLPPSRVRIAADVTEQQRETLNDMAFELNMSYSEMMQALADGDISLRWNR